MDSRYQTIRYERRSDVGTLTLARPAKRNAINPQMRRELAHLGAQLATDDTLRCLIVAGDGPSFCAGLDLREDMSGTLQQFTEHPGDDTTVERGLEIAGVLEWIPRLHCPSIAAVAGHAFGGGAQLAIACDFRIFAQDALLGLTETRYGLLPDMGATFRLPRIVGDGRARELILLGDTIDAATAMTIGLANRVVPNDQLNSSALALADRVAARPPVAVRGARRAIDAGWCLEPAAALRLAVREQANCLASADFQEACRALLEDRRPR